MGDTALHVSVHRVLSRYAMPVLVLTGITGNAIVAVVFWKGKTSSTTTLFISLALSDIGYTLTVLLWSWVRSGLGIGLHWFPHGCKIGMYLGGCFTHISNFTVTLIVLERVLSLAVPHRVKVIVTNRRCVIALAVVWASFFVYYTHTLIGFGDFATPNATLLEQALICAVQSEWYGKLLEEVLLYLELLFILPPILIIVLGNIFIAVRLHRPRLSTTTRTSQASSQTRSVTVKAAAISIFHVTCILPWVTYLAFIGSVEVADEEKRVYAVISEAVMFCSHLQAAVNIILYMSFGTKFRQDIKAFLSGRCAR